MTTFEQHTRVKDRLDAEGVGALEHAAKGRAAPQLRLLSLPYTKPERFLFVRYRARPESDPVAFLPPREDSTSTWDQHARGRRARAGGASAARVSRASPLRKDPAVHRQRHGTLFRLTVGRPSSPPSRGTSRGRRRRSGGRSRWRRSRSTSGRCPGGEEHVLGDDGPRGSPWASSSPGALQSGCRLSGAMRLSRAEMSPSPESSTPRAALNALILVSFSADELRRWLRHGPDADIVPALPGETASFADLVDRTLAALERRGRIDAGFFARLQAERPNRKGNMSLVGRLSTRHAPRLARAMSGLSRDLPSTTPAPPRSPTRRQPRTTARTTASTLSPPRTPAGSPATSPRSAAPTGSHQRPPGGRPVFPRSVLASPRPSPRSPAHCASLNASKGAGANAATGFTASTIRSVARSSAWRTTWFARCAYRWVVCTCL